MAVQYTTPPNCARGWGLTAVGEEVEMRITRSGAARAIRTKIAAPDVSGGDGQVVPQLPGLRVVEIERGSPLFQRLQGGGLVVSAVEQNSAAWVAGFRPGDIIYSVNRRRVQSAAELQASLRGTERRAVGLLRGDFNLTIILR
jgi:serine protease Do/serine protease DegQ